MSPRKSPSMASKLVGVRVPDTLYDIVKADAEQQGKTIQVVMLSQLMNSYGLTGTLPPRGAATQFNADDVKRLRDSGKSVAEISESLGCSKTRVYELLALE